MPHGPDHVQQLCPFGDFSYGDGLVVAHPFVAIQFYSDCLEELLTIVIPSGSHRSGNVEVKNVSWNKDLRLLIL